MMDEFKFKTWMVVIVIIQVAGIIGIFEVSHNENQLMDEWDGLRGDRAGFYDHRREIIVMFTDSSSISYVQFGLMHEMCHHIHYKYLWDDQRNEYKKISNNATEWVREYSKTNLKEDFADHCGAWVLGMYIDKEREEFFERNIAHYLVVMK